jgi:hypothetical protein
MAKKSNSSFNQRIPPDGTIRQSQVVTTFGPGAMMDLVDRSIIVGGLDLWRYDKKKTLLPIHEPRLRDAIAPLFTKLGKKLSQHEPFRIPPIGDDQEPHLNQGIQAVEFPEWMICQNPKCRALVKKKYLEIKAGRYIHSCSRGKDSLCVPVRFVAACKNGHIQDFPWVHFVHGKEGPCDAPRLTLIEGASGDFSEIEVKCACGMKRSLNTALEPKANPDCWGLRPWLGYDSREACTEKLHLLVRTATNSYFSQSVSALHVPEQEKKLDDAIAKVWDIVQSADHAGWPHLKKIAKVQNALSGFKDTDILKAIADKREGKEIPRKPLRTAEYETFIAAPPEITGELPKSEEQFFARTIKLDSIPQGIGQIVLAKKLREVRAQIGFTRLEPMTPDLQGEFDLEVKSAPLALDKDWLPAIEVLGEGVFIRIDDDFITSWEKKPAVIAREQQLQKGYLSWAEGLSNAPEFPGVRFYLLHSLSHLLISAISLECGYAASAIRERIYCAPSSDDLPMAAILLSTGSTSSEGTLGGLVEQGRNIREHLRRAYDLGVLCSNDPVCASHSPAGDYSERFLEGAACHGCLFIAECACERSNRYLDRALVVPTIGHDPQLAFFPERP